MEKGEHIGTDTRIFDVIAHPAFGGEGRLLFPWDERERYNHAMTMRDAPGLCIWHSNTDVDEMVRGVNRMIDDIDAGKQVLFDIYSDEEKKSDPTKRDTKLFFFRGEAEAPFAVICPGGGFAT